DVRPSPAGVDLIEQRARRIVQPGCRGLLRLQMIALEAGPALKRIVVPRASGQVFIDVEITVAENVEAGALLIADDDGERVLELLAEAHVEHASIERAAPHADIKPSGSWKRAGDSGRQNKARGSCEH